MKDTSLDLLACPNYHGSLKFDGVDGKTLLSGTLTCPTCDKQFSIADGIPPFCSTRRPDRARPPRSMNGTGMLATWLKTLAPGFLDWLTIKLFLESAVRRARAGKIEV